MIVTTLFAWVGWTLVLTSISPLGDGIEGLVLFYLSLLLSLIGTFAIAGFLVRTRTQPGELPYRIVIDSFRQSLFFSLLIIGVLIFQSTRTLSWLTILLLMAALTLAEFAALSLHRVRRKT